MAVTEGTMSEIIILQERVTALYLNIRMECSKCKPIELRLILMKIKVGFISVQVDGKILKIEDGGLISIK